MLVYASKLIGTPVYSVSAGGPLSQVAAAIVDPDSLKIIAFRLQGGVVSRDSDILVTTSIREYSPYGIVIDDIEELVAASDVVKVANVLKLNFSLIGLKVETKKGSKLGKIINFTVNSDNFTVQQIIVRRPAFKSFIDPELTIHRREIVEVTDYKIIVKDEEKTIRERATKEDFVPNFVNPFRGQEPGFAPADTKTPDGKDTK